MDLNSWNKTIGLFSGMTSASALVFIIENLSGPFFQSRPLINQLTDLTFLAVSSACLLLSIFLWFGKDWARKVYLYLCILSCLLVFISYISAYMAGQKYLMHSIHLVSHVLGFSVPMFVALVLANKDVKNAFN